MDVTEADIYDKFSKMCVPDHLLEAYQFPVPDPVNPNLRKSTRPLNSSFQAKYTCCDCKLDYPVDRNTGIQLSTVLPCKYHPCRITNGLYRCCSGTRLTRGCKSKSYHVHDAPYELENFKGFVRTLDKPELDPNRHGVFGLDCEMCFTAYGPELGRVTIINHNSILVYDEYVKPSNKVLDYKYCFSGITESHIMKATKCLKDVQRDLLQMFSSKTIIVGHGLSHDMNCLKLFHRKFVDTIHLYPHRKGLPFKQRLSDLARIHLFRDLQSGECHDSASDTNAALDLVKIHHQYR